MPLPSPILAAALVAAMSITTAPAPRPATPAASAVDAYLKRPRPKAPLEPCPTPLHANWSTKSAPEDRTAYREVVNAQRVNVVRFDLPEAQAKLRSAPFQPITLAEAARFIGRSEDQIAPPSLQLKPYLVRAVIFGGAPRIEVAWRGRNLVIRTASAGCIGAHNAPLIIFLDREPAELFLSPVRTL